MGFEDFILKIPIATCKKCQYRFRFSDLQTLKPNVGLQCPKCQTKLAANDDYKLGRATATATRQVKVTERGYEYRIDIRWLSKSSIFAILFALAWNASIVLAGHRLFFENGNETIKTSSPLFILIHVAVGLWLAYIACCEVFNTTTILIRRGQIEFWTKPFSIAKNQVVNVSDVVNLSVERTSQRTQNGKTVFKNFINIQLQNGKSVRLCRVQNLNEGIYVERLIEDKLGLVDDPKLDQVAF